jgi:SPIRAL1-like protein
VDSRSSNAYASGANQNCGNFVTDRRTTRVAAPPGGRSQISFG